MCMFYKSHNKVKTLCSKFYIQALISICCIGMSRAVEGGENPEATMPATHWRVEREQSRNGYFSWLPCLCQRRQQRQMSQIMDDQQRQIKELKQVSFDHVPALPHVNPDNKLRCAKYAKNMANIMAEMIKCENALPYAIVVLFGVIMNAFCDIPSTEANPNEAEFRNKLEQGHYDMLLEPLRNQFRQYLLIAHAYEEVTLLHTITDADIAFVQERKLSILLLITNAFQNAHDTLPEEALKYKIDADQVQNLQTYLMSLANKMDKIAIIQEIILFLPAIVINCLASSNPGIVMNGQELSQALDDIRYMNLRDQLGEIDKMHHYYDSFYKKSTYKTDQMLATQKLVGQLSKAKYLIDYMNSMQFKIDALLRLYDKDFMARVDNVHGRLSNLRGNESLHIEYPQSQQLEESAVSIMRWINQYKSDESQDTGPAQSNIDGLIGLLTNRKAIWDSVAA